MARKRDTDPAQLDLLRPPDPVVPPRPPAAPAAAAEVRTLRHALTRAEARAKRQAQATQWWMNRAQAKSQEAQALAQENAAQRRELEALRQENSVLRMQLAESLLTGWGSTRQGAAPEQLAREIRRIIGLVHPDRWGGHPLADLVTRELLELRSKVNEV